MISSIDIEFPSNSFGDRQLTRRTLGIARDEDWTKIRFFPDHNQFGKEKQYGAAGPITSS
jgi:hypothetical protein